MNPLEEREVLCPWCSETFDIELDVSGGDRAFTEDCSACCQPIEFNLHIGEKELKLECKREGE